MQGIEMLRANAAALVLMLERAIEGATPIDAAQVDALAELAQSARLPTMASRADTLLCTIRPRVPARHPAKPRLPRPIRRRVVDNSPGTPFIRAACRAGARYEWDDLDERADTEGVSAEWMEEITGHSAPVQPHVERGLMISAAIARGLYDPDNAHDVAHFRTRGHYQKQNAQRASERVAAGGIGKREIVTREDKTRRIVRAAARRLDIIAAQTPTTANPLLLQAIAIVRGILRPV